MLRVGVARRLLVMAGLAVAGVVVSFLPILVVDVYGNGLAALVLAAPFLGAVLGGWWVSRSDPPRRRLLWTLGVGFAVGLVAFLLAAVAVGSQL